MLTPLRRTAPLALAACLGGCNWIALARNAASYQQVARGEAANLAAADSLIYATLAEDGVAIVDARSGATVATIAPAPGSESADDIAIADGLLFVLDARAPGHLSVYSLADPRQPSLVSAPRPVPVGPFSGISAGAGTCLVSGGTSSLTAWSYDSSGALAGPWATGDFGRGQPDVLLAPGGRTAWVSTHYWGPYFGLDVVRLEPSRRRLDLLGKTDLDGAGFTAGGSKPANFPIESAALGRDTALIADARGLTLVDVTDPARPRADAPLDLGGPAVNVDVQGRTALVAVAGAVPSLALVAFQGGPGHIVRRIALPAGTRPAGVVLTQAYAAVAARDRGVLVFGL